MSMVLEYPMKMFILLAVVLVVIGIIISYRSKIMEFSFFEDEQENKCDIETVVSSEQALTSDNLQKYCSMCYMKNDNGECMDDTVCYVVNIDNTINPSTISLSSNYCSIKCNKDVTSVYVQYKGLTGTVEIAC